MLRIRLAAFVCGSALSSFACTDSPADPPELEYNIDAGTQDAARDAQLPPTDAAADAAPPAPPPVAAGCVNDVTAGDHVYNCEGMRVDATIPERCLQPGCGIIVELHGDTGSGLLMDAHMNLRALVKTQPYIVLAPTGAKAFGGGNPGSTWRADDDAKVVAMTKQFEGVFRADPKKLHATGFSRGGFLNWRLVCDYSEYFASFAPAAAGDGGNFGEATCFSNGRKPTRKADILFLVGKTDASVGYQPMLTIRNRAIADYAATGPTIVKSGTGYQQQRWVAPGGATVEVFEHSYETIPNGPFGSARGHCFPGSKSDPMAPQYAVPCKLPNAFTWGEEVLKFFVAHPKQ